MEERIVDQKMEITAWPWRYCNTHIDDANGLLLMKSARRYENLNCHDVLIASLAPEAVEACLQLANWMQSDDDERGSVFEICRAAMKVSEKLSDMCEEHVDGLIEKQDG